MEDAAGELTLVLAALDRLEAERRLRSIPAALLESSWAREAQTEAVVDALLVASMGGDALAYAHARHVGEWAARIAGELPCAPSPAFMRRCGVLCDVDPAVLERLPEVRDCAPVVRAFQNLRLHGDGSAEIRAAALILAAADEFDSLTFEGHEDHRHSPSDALQIMVRCANEESRAIVQALLRALRSTHATLLPATA